MEEEQTEEDVKKKGRMRFIVILLLVLVLGIALYVSPIFLYPDNVVHDAILGESNDHTTEALLTLDEGTYEVWMTTSLWSWFYLDQPVVDVIEMGGSEIDVDYKYGGDERSIDGEDCRHFATFVIREKAEYNVTVTAGVMDVGLPGTERVYIIEERPSGYAVLQWSGILAILVGVMGMAIVLLLMGLSSSEKRKREQKAQAPQPGMYPPQGYPPYPPQQPQYGYYPPPQQPPPYPPPGQQPPPYPPPGQQPPPYPPPGQQPPPGQYRQRPPQP